jgi:hypothetical protein
VRGRGEGEVRGKGGGGDLAPNPNLTSLVFEIFSRYLVFVPTGVVRAGWGVGWGGVEGVGVGWVHCCRCCSHDLRIKVQATWCRP